MISALAVALSTGVLAPGQDSSVVGSAQQTALDSTITAPRVADPVIRVVQWIFQRPPWVMWGGAVLGVIVAVVLLRFLWLRRRAILGWLGSRRLAVKFLLAGLVAALFLVVAGFGYRTNEFIQKDNRFCNGCHIFVGSGEAWVLPDTGNYSLVHRLEGKHDTLSCHTCHALHPMKEAVKLVYWMSGRRDKEIPPHAKVPQGVCEGCHVRGDAKETWQAIATTAGHRTHLESDSLAGKVGCLTCHAKTAHRFQPVNTTCAQQGCHLTDSVEIRLGKMADQTTIHCTVCHQFTREVPLLATRDSAAGTLVPKIQQCQSCHQMVDLTAKFDPAKDPHNGTCGTCHNPHRQTTPGAALVSCTASGCHADYKKYPFHTGLRHRKVAEQCQTCHLPHQARVDASDCTGCHEAVRERTKGKLAPPEAFDTTKALRQVSLGATVPPSALLAGHVVHLSVGAAHLARGHVGLGPRDSPAGIAALSVPSDSFSHTRHKRLACLTCHTTSSGHGGLTFAPPRGCQICHHQAPATSQCSTCHVPDSLPRAVPESVTVTVGQHAPVTRLVPFSHATHDTVACVTCHVAPVSLAPSRAVTTCASCHEAHHAEGRACATCHNVDTRSPHERPVIAHRNCDDCHAATTVASLVPTRSFCITCHADQVDHYPTRECSTCHFLQDPAAFRQHLTRGTSP